jgi:hypothetical protein
MSTRIQEPRPPRLKSMLRNLALGVPALVMLIAADGDCALNWLTAQSPVQAVASVTLQPNGEVAAELTLISTADWKQQRWADGATNVQLRVPDGSLVELEPVGEGRYRARSDAQPELAWMPGQRYRVTFELDDPKLAGDFAGEDSTAASGAASPMADATRSRSMCSSEPAATRSRPAWSSRGKASTPSSRPRSESRRASWPGSASSRSRST